MKFESTTTTTSVEKPLTADQRKMLAKLTEERVKNKINEVERKLASDIKERVEEVDKKMKTDKTVLKMIEEYKKCEKTKETLKAKFAEMGFNTMSYNFNVDNMNISESNHKEIKILQEAKREKETAMRDARDSLMADIYGLSLAYGEMLEKIESTMNLIGNIK